MSDAHPADAPHTSTAAASAPQEGVSIVIPAYNEERGIAPTLEDLLSTLDTLDLGAPVEILVVNDGSSDGTAAALAPFEGRVRAIHHKRNRGYGASLKTGIHAARYPWILITDADGTYPNEFLPHLWNQREDRDMVVGARTGANTHIPLVRRPAKMALRKLASWLSGRDIPDLNSGFRLMRKDVVHRFENLLPDGFSFTTTITLAMLSGGYEVLYTPIDYHRRAGSSKIRPIADTLNFTRLILRTILYFDPLRVFLPLALLFVLASIGVGVGGYLASGRVMDVTTVLLFVTGIHMAAIGMLADMLNRRIR